MGSTHHPLPVEEERNERGGCASAEMVTALTPVETQAAGDGVRVFDAMTQAGRLLIRGLLGNRWSSSHVAVALTANELKSLVTATGVEPMFST